MGNHQGCGRKNRHIPENKPEKDAKHPVPRKITNELLYGTTNQNNGHRQLKGNDTPAKLVLNEFRNTRARKFMRGQKLT